MDFGTVLNKFRKFSEWHDFADANQDLLNSEVGYMMLLKEVISTDLGFVSHDFSDLVEAAKTICNSITKTNSSVSFITRDLEHLVSVHEGFAKQKEEMRVIQKEADDAARQSHELHAKLVNLQQTSNNTDEIVRCQGWYDAAARNEDVCRARCEQHRLTYDVEFAAYQREFVQTLTAVLGEVFKVKAKRVEEIAEKVAHLNNAEVEFGINFAESDERVNAELAKLRACVGRCERGLDERLAVTASASDDLLVVSEIEGDWPDSSDDDDEEALVVDEEKPFIRVVVRKCEKPRLRPRRKATRKKPEPRKPTQAELRKLEKDEEKKDVKVEEAPKSKLDYRDFLVDSMIMTRDEAPEQKQNKKETRKSKVEESGEGSTEDFLIALDDSEIEPAPEPEKDTKRGSAPEPETSEKAEEAPPALETSQKAQEEIVAALETSEKPQEAPPEPEAIEKAQEEAVSELGTLEKAQEEIVAALATSEKPQEAPPEPDTIEKTQEEAVPESETSPETQEVVAQEPVVGIQKPEVEAAPAVPAQEPTPEKPKEQPQPKKSNPPPSHQNKRKNRKNRRH